MHRGLKDAFEDLVEFFDNRFDEAEDRLEGFLDRVEDEVKREAYVMRFRAPEVPDIGRLVEESLSRAWSGASMIVSSVRLPKADLDLTVFKADR